MNKTLTTPAGIARYPRLNSPDTKFSEEGQYKVDLEMSAEDAEPFLKQIEAMFTEFLSAKLAEINNKLVMEGLPKKAKLKQHAAPWTENDGMVQLKLKVKATGKGKDGETYTRQPKLFDASGQITNENIGGGSKLKVAVVPYFWYTASLGAGITLQPKAVQILDLVTWSSGGTAEAYGFEVTEAPRASVKTGTNGEEVEW
jgi:hypothetical protein